jgi:predicted transcriptional regulator
MALSNVIQLSEFDVTQKAVLFSVKNESKDATQIADELKLSLSTVYKTLSSLEDLTLIEVHKFIFSNEGKKIKKYRSRIGKVEITLDDTEPILHLYPNKKF